MDVRQWVEPVWLVMLLIYVCTITASIGLLLLSDLVLKAINRPQKVETNE